MIPIPRPPVKQEQCLFESPNGLLKIAASRNGIMEIALADATELPGERPSSAVLKQCVRELSEYFEGSRTTFSVPVDPEGTYLQKKIWYALAYIPFGSVTTYGELAKRCHKPGAGQAVGRILGKNPVPILLPCHRVIGSGGKLTGFGWGIPWKVWLLRHEKVEMPFGQS